MAQDSWPQSGRNGGSVTVPEHEQIASGWSASGVLTGDRTRLTGSTSTITVPAMTAILQGVFYSNTADVTVNVPANNSPGTVRVDRIVLELTKSSGSIVAACSPGVPVSGTPAPPPLVSDGTKFELPLSTHAVIAAQLPSSCIDDRRFVGGDSTTSGSDHPPLPPVRVGHRWYQSDTGFTKVWDNGWQQLGRGPAISVRFGSTASTSAAKLITVPFAVEVVDGFDFPASGAASLAIPETGRYSISGGAVISGGTGGAFIVRRGSVNALIGRSGGSGSGTAPLSRELSMAAGDAISFAADLTAFATVKGDNFAESGVTIRRVS